MTGMGSWVLMTWVDFASWLVLTGLLCGLVGLIVGYRAGVRSRARSVPSDCRPVVSAHEAFSPDSLHPLDHAEGGPGRG